MKVLISGAGIAGPTLAWWLRHYGIGEITIVERAPALRTGGYIIDFWGLGFDVAARMGILPELRGKGYPVREVRAVGRDGRKIAGFPASAFSRVAGGNYVSIPRSELAASIYSRIAGEIETIFGDSIASLNQTAQSVHVSFEHSPPREFDLVIGAGGLHSRVRDLAFGPEPQFEKYLGYKAAAFDIAGYRPRDELVYVMYTELHQQVARFAMRGDRTMFLFTFADPQPEIPSGLPAQKALLHARFAASGWECPAILEALDRAPDLYFDRVSQIRMPGDTADAPGTKPGADSWSHGRVALLGDAAFCVSLLAGQGAALAMAAAYILAGELHKAAGDYALAFARYRQIFAPFVRAKQQAALRFAGFFAPKSRLSLFARNRIMNLLATPLVADLAFSRGFRDKLPLPEY